MRLSTIIILIALAFVVFAKAGDSYCFKSGNETYCFEDQREERKSRKILEEMRDTQKEILEEQERANMEAEFYREYNSNE